jgi:hypothetical protein
MALLLLLLLLLMQRIDVPASTRALHAKACLRPPHHAVFWRCCC